MLHSPLSNSAVALNFVSISTHTRKRSGSPLTVHRQIGSRIPDNKLALVGWSQIVFAINLRLPTTGTAAASPNINMPDTIIIPVCRAFRARVFHSEVFLRVRIIDYLAPIELAGRRCKCQRIGIGASASGFVASTAVVGDTITWGVVIRPPVESMCYLALGVA